MFSLFVIVLLLIHFLAASTTIGRLTTVSPSSINTPTITDPSMITPRFWWFFTSPDRIPIKSPDLCGLAIKPRIVGGHLSAPNGHPWMASVRTRSNSHFCGGAIVTARHVLTAAHCVSLYRYFPFALVVSVGAETAKDGTRLGVELITLHPKFAYKSLYDADLAIMQLKEAIEFGPKIQPVCLPDLDAGPPEGEGVVCGWGLTKEGGKKAEALTEVTVNILPSDSCKAYGPFFTDNMICAGNVEGGRDSCKGDSGGPMVQFNTTSGVAVLVGVVSFGYGCARPSYPGLYTRIDRYMEWVLTEEE